METDLQAVWERVADEMSHLPGAAHGRMMSAPALTFNGKVFVFFSTKGGRTGLGCRLGRDFDFGALGLTDWQHLAPFRTKPPMKDWIVAGKGDLPHWEMLARTAYDLAKGR